MRNVPPVLPIQVRLFGLLRPRDVRLIQHHPVTTIRLARLYDIPEVLPAAFYDLSRVHMFDSPTADFSHRDLDLESLPSKELAILVKGMAKLRRSIMWDKSLYISPNPDFSACDFRGVAPS